MADDQVCAFNLVLDGQFELPGLDVQPRLPDRQRVASGRAAVQVEVRVSSL